MVKWKKYMLEANLILEHNCDFTSTQFGKYINTCNGKEQLFKKKLTINIKQA
jgi:hypothetical protein